jgi:hypothetical protein
MPRELVRELHRVRWDGLVAGRRLDVAEDITDRALAVVGRCSETEARLIRTHPTGAERYQVLVDALAALGVAEIERLRQAGRAW